MRRAACILALTFPLLAQQEGVTPRSTTERPNVSAAGMDQTLTGLLMDASCKAIADGRSDLTQIPSTSRTPATMRHDGETGANAQSTQGETARTRTEQEQRAMKVYSPQTTGPDRASATGTTGAAANDAPAPGARNDADDRMPHKTEGGSTVVGGGASTRRLTEIGGATSGPDRASATGTTGAAVGTAPTQAGQVQSLATAGAGTSGQMNERSRIAGANSSASSGAGTVRDKYRDCMVKPSTSSFAIHADGTLYVLDRVSNQMVHDQMRNEAFRASMSNQRDASQWMTVTVQGTPTSDNVLTIRSFRK